MIRGNVMDVFTIYFEDGEQISLIAKDGANAHRMASEVAPSKKIIKVEKIGQWENEA
jgi:hypothetical protein